ncbi:hypothetical protein [Aeromicrobium marinum]|uniref:hypothetical protein n=1 Tax=Aeromicrobium marinum TaxID=219314 RepID=UPI0006830CE2|nr:hypothetical protein [Aeromicrobium marinum]
MNSTLTRIVIAAPLAAAAFALTTVPATAGPGIDPGIKIVQPGPVDPDPQPQPGPVVIGVPEPGPVGPQGPGDVKAPVPGPVDPDPKPQGPGDIKAPQPGPADPKPQGPGDLTAPAPCPTHGADCGGDEPVDEPGDSSTGDDTTGDPTSTSADREFATPTRIDAGTPAADDDLTWMLLGGSLVALSGAAVAARTLARRG